MKDIKELIYAAVEENAVAFQELAGGILQARAYDAIESLRPEIGASMFGESSHMKGKDDEEDDEDEEMEDEEDEDEEDDKKKSMKEALHPNQQKIDVVDDEKIDAKDFAKLRAMKKEEVEIDETAGAKLRKVVPGLGKFVAGQRAEKAWAHSRGGGPISDDPSKQSQDDKKRLWYQKKAKKYEKIANEEVEQIDEIGDTPRGKAALTNLASQRFGRARWAGGVHRALAGSERHATTTSPHSRLQDKDAAVAHKAAAKVGIKPHEVPDHNYDYDKKGGYGTKVADPAHKFAARNSSTRFEEVEGLDELSTDKLTKYTKAANASRASLNKKWDQGKASQRDKEKVINHEKGEDRAHKVLDRRALVDKEMNEVAMPQNQADMLAHILHQVKISGHPVATDAQFRATTVGKDTTKKASLEPGADKLQYTIAQGGNVKP